MPDETAIIAQRLRKRLLSPTSKNIEQAARDLLDRQAEDGSWPDVDYGDESRTHWKASRHLSHLEVLARAYSAPASALKEDAQVRDAFQSGLQYWVDRHPVSENWWYNVIAAPRSLSDILLLMVDELPPDLIDATTKLIRESGFTRTGANLVDEARNLLTLACATGNAELLQEAIRHISEEIKVTTEEGIQCDDSFHQHGPQNMVISYGHGAAAGQLRRLRGHVLRGGRFRMRQLQPAPRLGALVPGRGGGAVLSETGSSYDMWSFTRIEWVDNAIKKGLLS